MKNQSSDKYTKIKNNSVISIIVHGGNLFGEQLATTLLEQGGRVIIIDHYDSNTKKIVNNLKAIGEADFIDFQGMESLYESLNRVDYIFYLLNEKTSKYPELTSKDFLEESSHLNLTLKQAQKYSAKTALVTNINLNRQYATQVSVNSSQLSPYSSFELQKYCETLSAEFRDKYGLGIRIIRLGELLGKNISQCLDPVINKMISDAITRNQIIIEGEGLERHFIVNVSDAIYGILKLTFDEHTEGEVISLTNNHEYSTLSIAYKLLELNPDIKDISFVSGKNNKQLILENYIPAVNAAEFGWKQNVSIEETMIDAMKTINPKYEANKKSSEKNEVNVPATQVTKVEQTGFGKVVAKIFFPFTFVIEKLKKSITNIKEEANPVNTTKFAILSIIFTLAFVFIIYPISSSLLAGYLAFRNIKQSTQYAQEMKVDQALVSLDKAGTYIEKTGKGLNSIKWMMQLTGQNELYDNVAQLVFGSKYAVSGGHDVLEAVKPLMEYVTEFKPAINFQTSLPTNTREYQTQLLQLQNNRSQLEKGMYSLQLSSSLIESVNTSVFPEIVKNQLVEVKTLNDRLINQLEPVEKLIVFLPDFVGVKERMTYLILLQNPYELRSTGGWISSYALVGFEHGQLRELKVDDVYNFDGQLDTKKIVAIPSQSMRQALGVNNLKLSLSNWDPDTRNVYAAAQYLLSQEDPGREIDGLITIDTEFFKSLISIWSEVKIPGESEAITADNFDSKLFELHKQFKPGESVKSGFLANLSNIMLQKVLTANTEDALKIGDSLISNLNKKHILVYLKSKEAFEYFDKNNWAGTLKTEYQSSPIAIEWNWGANKANKYLERTANLDVDIISEKEVKYGYKLAIKNGSTSKVYPQGDYINYERVYLPLNAKIESIKGFESEKYDIFTENGFKVIGGWFNVPTLSVKNLEIKYKLISDVNTTFNPITKDQQELTMNLDIFKQPGTNSDNINLKMTYPDTWAVSKSEGFEKYLNQLSIQAKRDSDKKYLIIWKIK